jgi:hypothetical protein
MRIVLVFVVVMQLKMLVEFVMLMLQMMVY